MFDWFILWLQKPVNFIFLTQLAFVLGGGLLVQIMVRRAFARLLTLFRKTETIWDDALVHAMQLPVVTLLWLIMFFLLLKVVHLHAPFGVDWIDSGKQSFSSALMIIVAWFILRFINFFVDNFKKNSSQYRLDFNTANAIANIARIVIIAVTAIIILHTMGVNMAGLLTFGGASTIVVGLAAQNLLSNLFGGLMIFLDRSFKVGDWIRSPDRNIEGVVEEINWRYTRIRTFDRRPLYVPNAVFSNIAIENPSRMSNRRIKETVGVRYQDAAVLPDLLKDLREMLANHPDIASDRLCMCHFLHYGPSSLDISLYLFTSTTNWEKYRSVQEDVLLKILAIVDKHGAQVAFPTTTMHVPEPVTLAQASAGEPVSAQ